MGCTCKWQLLLQACKQRALELAGVADCDALFAHCHRAAADLEQPIPGHETKALEALQLLAVAIAAAVFSTVSDACTAAPLEGSRSGGRLTVVVVTNTATSSQV